MDEHFDREDLEEKIRSLVNNPSFIMFFDKDKDIYGASEDSRVTFARMKNPDVDDEGWEDDADFMAINLSRTLQGELPQAVFGKKDLKKIHVIDRGKAEEKLLQQAKSVNEPRKSSEVISIVMSKKPRGS